MEKAERLENLEKCVNNLIDRIAKIESALANIQQSNQTSSPYSGNAFQSPYGNPFRYTTVVPIQSVSEIPNQNDVIIQKLDRLLDLFNNNFSRLNFKLEDLESAALKIKKEGKE